MLHRLSVNVKIYSPESSKTDVRHLKPSANPRQLCAH